MKKKKIEELQRQLKEMRTVVEKRVQKIEQDYRVVPPADLDDRSIERENDEVLEKLKTSGLTELGQIDLALNRIKEGSYEQCKKCGSSIAVARLEALPYTSVCRNCA